MTYGDSVLIRLQLGYLSQPVHQTLKKFIGGGRSLDFSARAEFVLSPRVALSALARHEHWKFPILSTKA